MLRTIVLFSLVITLVLLPGRSVSQAATSLTALGKIPAPGPIDGWLPEPVDELKTPLGSAQTFMPGQVLVRFKPGVSLRVAASLVAPHGATPMRQLANHTFVLAVPAGREEQTVEALESNPAVQHASLNYRIIETPIAPLKPVIAESAPLAAAIPLPSTSSGDVQSLLMGHLQEPASCITDLWMSTTQQGERLLDNMVPSGTPQVYVFFEYADCELEAIRIQVFELGRDTAPQEVFNEEGTIISGSGIQGIKVRAWPYFDQGVFRVGRYLTILSLSPEGGWDQVKNVSWRVSTFSNDHWFRGVSNYQWPLHSTGRPVLSEADINAPQAWDISTGSPDFVIAIVSTGVAIDHPDLRNKIWTNRDEVPGNGIDDDENGCVDDVHGCEFFNGEANPNPTDTVGWGTMTSGIAAAETNNEIGMAGVSWGARIMPIKVLRLLPGNILGGYLADMITAIDYAVANGARIIHLGPRIEDANVSEEQLELLRSTIDDAVSLGVLVIAGTGDLGENRLLYPAGFESVVAVGCSDVRNQRCWFSNYGSGIDLVAPGELVLSTWLSRDYRIGRGTSLAAAHVDGVAALIWSVNPALSPAEVRTILRESASDLGPAGYDEEFGYGQLDAAQAVMLTPHHLWLRTANLDRLGLVFLLDNQVNRTCQTVWNRGTGPQTWTLSSDSDWLTIENPSEPTLVPVPSDLQVCVDAESFAEPGSFEATLEASSTLSRHEGEVNVEVTAVFQPRLSRVWLSFMQRP